MVSHHQKRKICLPISNFQFGANILSYHILFSSLLGFSPLLVSSCNSTSGDIRVMYLNRSFDMDAFLNPVALLLCYYALVISSGFILDTKVKCLKNSLILKTQIFPINPFTKEFRDVKMALKKSFFFTQNSHLIQTCYSFNKIIIRFCLFINVFS